MPSQVEIADDVRSRADTQRDVDHLQTSPMGRTLKRDLETLFVGDAVTNGFSAFYITSDATVIINSLTLTDVSVLAADGRFAGIWSKNESDQLIGEANAERASGHTGIFVLRPCGTKEMEYYGHFALSNKIKPLVIMPRAQSALFHLSSSIGPDRFVDISQGICRPPGILIDPSIGYCYSGTDQAIRYGVAGAAGLCAYAVATSILNVAFWPAAGIGLGVAVVSGNQVAQHQAKAKTVDGAVEYEEDDQDPDLVFQICRKSDNSRHILICRAQHCTFAESDTRSVTTVSEAEQVTSCAGAAQTDVARPVVRWQVVQHQSRRIVSSMRKRARSLVRRRRHTVDA